MEWSSVGEWLKNNAGSGAALVGSLLTGNVPGAMAAGVSLVSGATGTDDPKKALDVLQLDPSARLKLKELQNREQDSIRKHVEAIKLQEFEDKQKEHHEAQETVRRGDVAQDKFVRWTRPGESWLSLIFAIVYALTNGSPSPAVLGLLLALPFSYAGLRGADKWVGMMTSGKK